jgi:hypothetical protein
MNESDAQELLRERADMVSVGPPPLDAVSHGRRAPGRRMRLAVTAVVAAAAVTAALLSRQAGFLTGQRASQPTSTSGMSYQEWEDGQPAVGADVREQAEHLYESFAGTVEQRSAMSVLEAYAGNKPIADCMARAGYRWDWDATVVYADPEDALGGNLWLQMPWSRWRSHDLLAAKPFLESEARMNRTVSSEYTSTLTSCQGDGGSRHSLKSDYDDAGIGKLAGEWRTMVANLEKGQLPDQSVYEQCMKSSDITMLRDEDWGEIPFATAVAYAMSGASPGDTDIPSNPQDRGEWFNPRWQEFIALEDEFDRADWTCREDVYTNEIANIAMATDDFEAAHAADIQRAHAFWLQVAEDAAAIGYTGRPL